MSTNLTTVKSMIDLWPSRRDLAEDLNGFGFTVSVERVHKWAQSGSIPAKYHHAFQISGQRRGFIFSAEDVDAAHHAPDDLPAHDSETSNNEHSHDNPSDDRASDAA